LTQQSAWISLKKRIDFTVISCIKMIIFLELANVQSGTRMDREYIAYAGKKFTIEWYFDSNGKSMALDYYKTLTAPERIKVLQLLKRMGDAGEIKDTTKFNYEGDHLYAFKPKSDDSCAFSSPAKRSF
jgi:hypothetical protein